MEKDVKEFLKYAGLTVTTLGALDCAITKWLYKFAFQRVAEVPQPAADKMKYQNDYYHYVDWLHQQDIETWQLHANDPHNKVVATWVPKPGSNKAVIVSHGYKGTGETMANFAHMFNELGYNVLLPDDRGQGRSSGKYLNFGWIDRIDYVDWIYRIIARLGENCEIILHGVSMGGATVELTAGEELPTNVKAIIADCGYSNLEDEMGYLLNTEFHLPKHPFLELASLVNKQKLGFYLRDVAPERELQKNHRPILFIHGERDVYVPTQMSRINYNNNAGPKRLWIVPSAVHAESFWINPYHYQTHVARFLEDVAQQRV